MSKALVIRGANFLANRVEQIEITESIPCTGIALSYTELAFTAIGQTQQLIATPTPANTTESLSFISSNPDILSVTANGLVTSLGLGTATITATCGIQHAICTVSTTVNIDLSSMYTFDPTKSYSGSINLPNKNWIGFNESQANTWRTYYNDNDTLGGYRAFYGSYNTGMFLMPVPNGATRVKATTPSGARNVKLILADSNTISKASGADGRCAAAVANLAINTGDYVDISAYSANGYIIYVETTNGVSGLDGHPVLTFA